MRETTFRMPPRGTGCRAVAADGREALRAFLGAETGARHALLVLRDGRATELAEELWVAARARRRLLVVAGRRLLRFPPYFPAGAAASVVQVGAPCLSGPRLLQDALGSASAQAERGGFRGLTLLADLREAPEQLQPMDEALASGCPRDLVRYCLVGAAKPARQSAGCEAPAELHPEVLALP